MISEESLMELMDENSEIKESFYSTYQKLNENIQFRNSLLRNEMIEKKLQIKHFLVMIINIF
jgi:hypothetical protein